MRLQYKDFFTHLEKKFSPCYFIFGEEPLQITEASDALRTKAYKEGYTERKVFEVSPHFDWQSLKTHLATPSLFSEKQLIECRLKEGKISKIGSEILTSLIHNPKENILLFLSAEKLDPAVWKSVWFSALERSGITFWARNIPKAELPKWLEERLKRKGLQADYEAIDCLIERSEGNLLAAAQSIEKLHLYAQKENNVCIHKDLIISMIGADTRFSIYDLVDSILEGSASRTTQIFNSLRSEGVEVVLILWAITREVRTIITITELLKKGKSQAEAMGLSGVFKHRTSLLANFIQNNPRDLSPILIQAKITDDIIKGRTPGNVWQSLFTVCLLLLGVNSA